MKQSTKHKTFTPKSAVRPNAMNQSYNHMQGQINDPADHPAYNMPDPAGATYGSANPPSADQQDMYEQQ